MTAVHEDRAETGEISLGRRVVHSLVLPTDEDPDTLPLYVDYTMARPEPELTPQQEIEALKKPKSPTIVAFSDPHVEYTGRHSLKLEDGSKISFATYFNAFPASYWRHWTDVQEVHLAVELSEPASVVVYKSNARGDTQRVEMVQADAGVTEVSLPLSTFGDGGWYWFDLHATAGDVELLDALWTVDADKAHRHGTATVAITTFNRPDYCNKLLATLGAADSLENVVDRVLVMDQGTQKVADDPAFATSSKLLGDRLRIVRQGNLGGSGGFSRGMHETVKAGESDYVLLLDDDIASEPEGIRRAVAFADFCRTPTIVGGHMFSMYAKSQLHAFAERVNLYKLFWGEVPGTETNHDFAAAPLRATRWLHKRWDGDYNGWWMCLIPVEVIERTGLSLPVFIKWDDAEFSLRARAHGYPTVSLPGAAVWHVPWTDKDDAIDWQAYYHQRNRWLVALLHSPYKRGGSLPEQSFAGDVKHLLTLQYSAVELRLKALEDLLSGPEHLHGTLATTLGEVRAMRVEHADAKVSKEPGAFPAPRRARPPKKGEAPTRPSNIVKFGASALTGALRQLRPVREQAIEVPEERVAAAAARWWRLSHLDSAVVTSADGAGASMYIRDPKVFRSYLMRSMRLHQQLSTRWPKLRDQYRHELAAFTDHEAWAATFEASTSGDDD